MQRRPAPELLDRYLPAFHFHETHSVQIAASAERVYRALQEVTAGEIPLVGVLFWLRALPARLAGGRVSGFRPHLSFLQQALAPGGGFLLLDEAPGRELVIGTVGQFWKIQGGVYPWLTDREDFLSFADPRYAKAALSFRLESAPARATRLITETRISTPSPTAHRRFAPYWLLIRPGSGLLRRLWLGAIRRRAERGA